MDLLYFRSRLPTSSFWRSRTAPEDRSTTTNGVSTCASASEATEIVFVWSSKASEVSPGDTIMSTERVS